MSCCMLTSEAIRGLRNKFLRWRESFESKGLKNNFGKTKVIVAGGITVDGLSKSKVDLCGLFCLKIVCNVFFCVQCGKWNHGRCARVKMEITKFKKICTLEMTGILERQWSRKKSYATKKRH